MALSDRLRKRVPEADLSLLESLTSASVKDSTRLGGK